MASGTGTPASASAVAVANLCIAVVTDCGGFNIGYSRSNSRASPMSSAGCVLVDNRSRLAMTSMSGSTVNSPSVIETAMFSRRSHSAS